MDKTNTPNNMVKHDNNNSKNKNSNDKISN